MDYLTRLTPNFFCWEKPSGRDGKCKGQLFEDGNGFGWEEWLLKDYHANKNKPEHVCTGFIQAFNGKNQNRAVTTLHLYTRLCNNQSGIAPGCYYLGWIDYVIIENNESLELDEVNESLLNVDVHQFPAPPFQNVKFKVKNVHFHCPKKNKTMSINLDVGQFRFALYDLNTHKNLQSQIKTIRKKYNL